MKIGIGLGIPHFFLKGVGYDFDAIGRAAVTSKLLAGTADINIGILGTSIGNASTEWARLLDPYYSAFASTYLVRHAHYYDTGSVYGSPSLGQGENARLTGATAGTSRFSDNFNRANGAVGTSSGGQSYGTVTAWAISSNRVVQNSFSNSLIPASDLPNTSYMIAISHFHGSDTTSTTGGRVYALYGSSSLAVYLYIQHNGVMGLIYQPGAVALTSVDTGADLTNGEQVDFTFVVDGRWIQGQVVRGGTTYILSALLTSSQYSALTGRKWIISDAGVVTGIAWDDLAINDISQTRRLTVWNASIAGSKISDHTTKVASTIGSSVVGTLDLLIVEAMSHNAGTDTPETFLSDLADLVTAARGQQTDVPIVLLMENPQTAPSTTIDEHAARVLALPAYARSNSMGIIDGFTGYDTADILSGDGLGVHPDATGSAFIALRAAQSLGID